MGSTLFVFTQEEHSLTLPLIFKIVQCNQNFEKYVLILIEDSFSIARIFKNFFFFGVLYFTKIVFQNLFDKVNLSRLDCQILHMTPNEFRSCQWFNLLDQNTYGLSVNCPVKISKKIIEKFNGNILNVHNSLLPKYGGLMPILRQVINRDNCFGSTVHLINENLDEGQILYQFCLRRPKRISPYQIWSAANSVNQELLCTLSPNNYHQVTQMDLSLKSYYSIPSWLDIFKYWLQKTTHNISG